MTIYIDEDFKCYTENAAGRTAVETDFFDHKCTDFVEGYRYVPARQVWTSPAGEEFVGEMAAPCTDYSTLDNAQREYERQQLADMRAALTLLGVSP